MSAKRINKNSRLYDINSMRSSSSHMIITINDRIKCIAIKGWIYFYRQVNCFVCIPVLHKIFIAKTESDDLFIDLLCYDVCGFEGCQSATLGIIFEFMLCNPLVYAFLGKISTEIMPYNSKYGKLLAGVVFFLIVDYHIYVKFFTMSLFGFVTLR